MFGVIQQFFSGLRPKLMPVYVRLTRGAIMGQSRVIYEAGTLGRVVGHYLGGRQIMFPGGFVANVPTESDLIEVVK